MVVRVGLIMAALCSRCGHYILQLWFLSFFFAGYSRQINSYGQFRRHLKTLYLGHMKPRRIVTFIFYALYKYTYLLTYLHGVNVWLT